MDSLDCFRLVLKIDVQTEPPQWILKVFEVKGIGTGKSTGTSQFRNRLKSPEDHLQVHRLRWLHILIVSKLGFGAARHELLHPQRGRYPFFRGRPYPQCPEAGKRAELLILASDRPVRGGTELQTQH